jgi:hypothetical protein
MLNWYCKKSPDGNFEKHFRKEIHMELIIGILGGAVAGALLVYILLSRKKPSGRFIMDFTNPAKDIFTVDLDDSFDDIYYKKHIVLEVQIFEDNSQN